MRTPYASLCTLSLLIILLCIVITGHASEPTKDLVTCEFKIVVTNGVTFPVQVVADVEEITLSASSNTYSKTEIQSFSTSNPELMGAIKYAIKTTFSEQLRASFPYANIIANQELPTYGASVFSDSYTITLSPTFFLLNETVNVYDFINGMLDCGANIDYTIPLQASFGWNNTYIFDLPEEITYRKTTGTVKQNTITWKISNTDGETPQKIAEYTLADKSPSSEGLINDIIEITFEMDCKDPKQTQLTILLNAEAINITSYNLFPPLFSHINVVPSDGIRLLTENNFTNWNNVYLNTIEPASKTIIDTIQSSSFNQTLDVVFSWDNTTTTDGEELYNITNMNRLPPVRSMLIDKNVTLSICNLSSRAVFGLVNAGADIHITSSDVNFGNNLDALEYSYNGSLILPEHVFLTNQQKFLWNQTSPLEGDFTSDIAPSYTNQDIDTQITIEIENTDMNLLSFFTGKTELTVGVLLSETQLRNVTTLSNHFKLPPQISLTYLNANGFRLCIDESLFSDEQIELFLRDQTYEFENRSKELFPLLQGKAQVDKTAFDHSLLWDGDISSKNDSIPIKVVSTFHSSYPLPFSFLMFPPGINVSKQVISLTGIPYQSVTYSMVFPKGTSVEIFDTLNRAEIKETHDGKKCLVVSFNASESDLVDVISINMKPSILFILGLFVPCIISFIIIIILIVVVYNIRKKRNQFRGSSNKKINNKNKKYETNEIEYEEDDDYIPPPPPSRRR